MIKNIYIVTILLFSSANADFIRNNNLEVVSDTVTCLMWQDNIATNNIKETWQTAIEYCDDLDLANFNDWRLPNINELYSINDKSKTSPAIKNAFVNIDNTQNSYYWSSTTHKNFINNASNDAWYVNFYVGDSYYKNKSEAYHARCVRDAQ